MKALILSVLIAAGGGNPIKELYSLQKYDQVISQVADDASFEDKTMKAFAYFQLCNYNQSLALGTKLLDDNKSDSLRFMLAKSAFFLGDDARSEQLAREIKDQEMLKKLSEMYSFPETNDILKSAGFRNAQNNGFCFVHGRLLIAIENRLEIDGKVIYESPGKFIAYPYVTGNQILFSANVYNGKDLVPGELSKISRERISKLQLFIGKFENGTISDVSLLPFNNIEYDYVSGFLREDGTIFFSSNAAGGYGGYDIYRVDKTATGYDLPENLGLGMNSKGNDIGYVEYRELVFYSSEKAGLGKLDLFSCMRNSKLYFGYTNIGSGVNSRLSDFSFRVENGKGYYNQAKTDGTLEIRVIDKLVDRSETALNAVNKFDDRGVIVNTAENNFGSGIATTNEVNDSLVKLAVDKMFQSTYTLKAYGYEPLEISSSNAAASNGKDVQFTPRFSGIVEDYITGTPLEGVGVYAIKGTDTIKTYTTSDGSWWHAVEENDGWKIVFDKNGYKERIFEGDKVTSAGLRNTEMGIDTKKGTKLEIRNIYFAYGKADIQPESMEVLDRIVQYMTENPEVRFELSAHTDSRGSDPVNMKLSIARASSAFNYLVEKGVSKDRLVPKGYGESRPVNKCTNGAKCSEEDFQMNRRVEIVIL